MNKQLLNLLPLGILWFWSGAALADAPEPAQPMTGEAGLTLPAEVRAPAEPLVDTAEPIQALNGFHAKLEARYGVLRGDITLDLEPTDKPDEYQYEVTTRTRGLARLVRSGTGREASRFIVTPTGFEPQSYLLDDGTKDKDNDTDIEYDWPAGIAHSIYEGEAKDIPLTDGVLDRLSADIAAIQALRTGAEPVGYDITHRNSIRRYDFRPLGNERIEVPAGSFDTVKYARQRPGSSRTTIIWYAIDKAYLPARIEQQKEGKTVITMVATELSPDTE